MRAARRSLTIGGFVALALALTIPAEAPADALKIQKYNVSARYLHEETFKWKDRLDSGPPCIIRRRWTHNGDFQEEWTRSRVRAVVRDLDGTLEVAVGSKIVDPFRGGSQDHIATAYNVIAKGSGLTRVTRPPSPLEECTHETKPERRYPALTAGCGTFKGKDKLGVWGYREPGSVSIGLQDPAKDKWGGYPGPFGPLTGDPEGTYCPGHRRAERGLEEKRMYAKLPARQMAAKPLPWSASRSQTYTIMHKTWALNPADAKSYPVKVEASWIISFVPVRASERQCKAAISQLRAENRRIGIQRDLTKKEAEEAVQECVQGGGLGKVWDTNDPPDDAP